MRWFAQVIWSCLVCLGCVVAGAQPSSASLQTPPLTPEQIGIYRAFLANYNNGSKATLNVANMTTKFESMGDEPKTCLKEFGNAQSAEIHRFAPDAFAKLPVRLVDPHLHEKRDPGDAIRRGESVDDAVEAGFAAALFTFSEMIYNRDHTRIAFTYAFVCGGLCGHGGTVVYERRGSKWVERKKTGCGSWIS